MVAHSDLSSFAVLLSSDLRPMVLPFAGNGSFQHRELAVTPIINVSLLQFLRLPHLTLTGYYGKSVCAYTVYAHLHAKLLLQSVIFSRLVLISAIIINIMYCVNAIHRFSNCLEWQHSIFNYLNLHLDPKPLSNESRKSGETF